MRLHTGVEVHSVESSWLVTMGINCPWGSAKPIGCSCVKGAGYIYRLRRDDPMDEELWRLGFSVALVPKDGLLELGKTHY
jgi:hypothetical protein